MHRQFSSSSPAAKIWMDFHSKAVTPSSSFPLLSDQVKKEREKEKKKDRPEILIVKGLWRLKSHPRKERSNIWKGRQEQTWAKNIFKFVGASLWISPWFGH